MGHSDPCRVPTLGKYKDLKYIQKVKSSVVVRGKSCRKI